MKFEIGRLTATLEVSEQMENDDADRSVTTVMFPHEY